MTPGPGSSAALVPELACRLGADRDQGLNLRLHYVSGGGPALRELASGNAQFGVFGLPAVMHHQLSGQEPPLVGLAAIERRLPIALMVRQDLRHRLRQVSDLRGRVLGVHSNAMGALSTGQQLANLMLRHHGVAPETVRFVAAGQTWESQASVLRGQLCDALVSEEPICSRLAQEGLAQPLLQLGRPEHTDALPGAGFLRATLISTRELLQDDPDLVARVVQALRQTLRWLDTHSPQALVAALGYSGAQSRAVEAMRSQYPQQFSADGRFSARQLAETEVFFRQARVGVAAGQAGLPAPTVPADLFAKLLVDRWVGTGP